MANCPVKPGGPGHLSATGGVNEGQDLASPCPRGPATRPSSKKVRISWSQLLSVVYLVGEPSQPIKGREGSTGGPRQVGTQVGTSFSELHYAKKCTKSFKQSGGLPETNLSRLRRPELKKDILVSVNFLTAQID